MKIRKIYVVAAIHGDEPFGLKVLAHLRELGDDRITRQVGHPEAVAKRKEFLETNLNRSFGPKIPDSKEGRIAKHLLADIKKVNPDLILDIHTCECGVGKSAVIPKLKPGLIDVAKHLGMEYVVEGDDVVTGQALFGQNPDKSMVLEFGVGLRSDRLAEQLARAINDLLNDQSAPKRKVKVYSKTRLVGVAEAEGENLENYKFNKKLQGYPYLVGKNTYPKYSDYVGFLAAKEETL